MKTSTWKRRLASLVCLTALLSSGCVAARPHITTKVIVQHEGVAAEAMAEWNATR